MSKVFSVRLFLAAVIIICFSLILGTIKSFYELSQITPISSPVLQMINRIEISSDKKSILNAETKAVIFTIADTQKYLKDSGYFYNPDTFQTTNAKYEGDCFIAAALSNSKDRIVFSTGCLPGDLPQAWVGIRNLIQYECPTGAMRKPNPPKLQFLIGGSGKKFVWSSDDKTITYDADLGLSGMTETRTIDSMTGEIVLIKNPCIGYENDADSTGCINDFLSKNLISSEIANSDNNLKNYLSQTFDLQDFKGISRGKFTNQINNNTIVVSFDNTQNQSTLIFIINEVEKGKWQAYYQNMNTFEILVNNPMKLVKNQIPFFLGKNLPKVGTCVPVTYSDIIYKLENNKFKKIWDINTFNFDPGKQPEYPAQTNDETNTIIIDTELSFKDVEKDENKEIIRQGTKKIWKGYCNNGRDEETIKIEKIHEVYKWSSQKQTFIKNN